MYQISSKTGVRHIVEAEMPDYDTVVKMWQGTELPTAKCGKAMRVVNFYQPDEKPNPRYQCGRCFSG